MLPVAARSHSRREVRASSSTETAIKRTYTIISNEQMYGPGACCTPQALSLAARTPGLVECR
jgi:hypothetical protein